MLVYDIVGDLHGYADALLGLLHFHGYDDTRGYWYHPDRHMVFVGDFCDRGPQQLELIHIVRNMVENGSASAVMGNHEYNAIGFATPDPASPGKFLRRRLPNNTLQHQVFLDAVGQDSELHRDIIAWFKTLPLWLDLDGFRVVHACWHPASMALVAPHLDESNRITPDGLYALYERGTPAYKAAEIVLKGLEVQMPNGVTFFDHAGHERKVTRVKWWDQTAMTYRTAALVDEATAALLPDAEIPDEARVEVDGKPIFFGHYWMEGFPTTVSDSLVCLDFSVAAGGYVASYAWAGEVSLTPDNMSWAQPSGRVETNGVNQVSNLPTV